MRFLDAARSPLLFAAALAVAAPVSAASLYGNLSQGGKPLRDATLDLLCAGSTGAVKVEPPGRSDAQGNYNLSIAAAGRCSFKVNGAVAVVVLGAEPARYDFDLSADSKTLTRR